MTINKHKYVRHEELGFIIFPMTHDLYHAHMRAALAVSDLNIRTFLSAGFADIGNGEVICYGESESLKLKSLPEDSTLLAKQLGMEKRNGS